MSPKFTARSGWQKLLQTRIPTILGLGILMIGVFAGITLLNQGTGGFLPRASEDSIPKQIRITNISDTSFTVSFVTDVAAPGMVEYGTAAGRTNIQVQDDRDQLANSTSSFTTHHITVRGLQPATQYYFRISTGGRTLYDNDGQPFSVRTPTALAAPSEAITAYGNVETNVGNPADGSIVYLSISGASPISAQVKSNGSWAAPLSGLRTVDLSSAFPLTPQTQVQIQVQGPRQDEVITTSALVEDLAPLQTLIFGQANQVITGAASTATPAPALSGSPLPSPTPSQEPSATPASSPAASLGTLFTPNEATQLSTTSGLSINLQNNEVINTTLPEFSGSAPANGVVQLEISAATPVYGAVQAGASGSWQWAPPTALQTGQQTITATYIDASGQQQVQRTFIVQAGDSALPAFSSTPSSQLATPTPTPLPTAIALATATPTPVPVAVTPTPVAVPTATPVASTVAAQPVSGSTGTTWTLLALATGFFVFGGAAAYFVTNKAEA